ncbi:sulfotransferase [Synechococcus sp. MIT S9507]|uniref:sulfotransferase n=1 Tax=Synechococcus sp. MIT S9507 TaxID=3082544 RepID=UPI0039B58121
MSKIFLLGVGCQKGGTTWIHDQLSKNEQCDFGFRKEYHVHDALHVPEHSGFLARAKKQALKQIRNGNTSPNSLQRLSFIMNQDLYYDYFDYLYLKHSKTKIVGDITPEYSALPEHALAQIRLNLELRGFKVKPVFIMRDPISRCISQIEMMRRKGWKQLQYKALRTMSLDNAVRVLGSSTKCRINTLYCQTIKNLERIFPQEDIFYSLYENLFEKETLEKFSKFLEEDKLFFDTGHRVNKNSASYDERVKKSTRKLLFNSYSDVYEFCGERFSASKAWDGWNYSK